MHENVPLLFPNPETSAKVVDYSIAKSTPLPDWLLRYHQWGVENTEVPDYLISTFQAQSLVFLTRIVGAKRDMRTVLELGVYIGFSGMVWSHAVGRDGEVVGLELSEEYAGIARRGFADNGVENVVVKVGDAVGSLAALEPPEPFDLIFLDANKDAYPRHLDTILERSRPGREGGPGRLLRAGGLIVADNVLRGAVVADPTPSNPMYAADVGRHGEEGSAALAGALRRFNDRMAAEPRIEAFLLPFFDGLGLGRLVD